MIQWTRGTVSFVLAAVLTVLSGCTGLPYPEQAKEHGVYTIVAVEGRSQDMPETGYRVCRVFDHGIMPAAVVTGYGSFDGSYNHPQDFTLQVVEAGTGTVVLTRSGEAYYGKAMVYDLPIRKTGNYQLCLLMKDTVYDTWNFTVNTEERVNGAISLDASGEKPGSKSWRFRFDLAPTSSNAAFTQYDKLFLNDLGDAVLVESDNSAAKTLPPAAHGKVVIQFNLDPKGLVHSPMIINNTLDKDAGSFFLRALEDGAPYRAWPPGGRAALASGTRTMVVTFFLN